MKINITETVLRDANQSLIATRMPMSDFEPILETMDKAGYYALECWGGAKMCIRDSLFKQQESPGPGFPPAQGSPLSVSDW